MAYWRQLAVSACLGTLALGLSSCGGQTSRPRDRPMILQNAEEPPPGTAYVAPVPRSAIRRHQAVYVPIYSHIYISDSLRPYGMSASLCVRNTDPDHPIVLTSVRYYDTSGKLVREDLKQPLRVDPMASVDTFVSASDDTGGLGANFIVEWVATQENVNPPIVEAVMVGSASGQGISFMTEGRPIQVAHPRYDPSVDSAAASDDASVVPARASEAPMKDTPAS